MSAMTIPSTVDGAATTVGYTKQFYDVAPHVPPFEIKDAPEVVRSVLIRVDFDPRWSTERDRKHLPDAMLAEKSPMDWVRMAQAAIEGDEDCAIFGAQVQYALVESYSGPGAYNQRAEDVRHERKLLVSAQAAFEEAQP